MSLNGEELLLGEAASLGERAWEVGLVVSRGHAEDLLRLQRQAVV